MNKKGFYGALIGLMALILVTSFVYLTQGTQQTQKTWASKENILEASKQWQRARYLLDKATADAFSDAALKGGLAAPGNECSLENITNEDINTNYVIPYFDNLLSTGGFNCTYSNLLVTKETINPTTWDANASIDLNCFQESKGSMAWVSTKAVFEKRIETTLTLGPPDTCRVVVKDRQASDSVEIDLTENI